MIGVFVNGALIAVAQQQDVADQIMNALIVGGFGLTYTTRAVTIDDMWSDSDIIAAMLQTILEISYVGHPDGRESRLIMIERYASEALSHLRPDVSCEKSQVLIEGRASSKRSGEN